MGTQRLLVFPDTTIPHPGGFQVPVWDPTMSEEKSILCVEDHEDTRTLLAILLELLGYTVLTATTVSDGLRIAVRSRIDLFLIDTWLPDGSGIDLCRRIRAVDPSAPILFVSGVGDKATREEAMAAGAQAYMLKPTDFFEFGETIGRLIRESKAAKRSAGSVE